MKRKPNFFIVGAPKAGTTAVYHQLCAHPDIYMSPVKEPNFFSRTYKVLPLQDYEALFCDATTEAIVGEASVSYLHNPYVPERIKAYDPTAKILVLIRHPVIRAYSHYRMLRNGGAAAEFPSFSKASQAAAEALRRGEEIPSGTGYRQSFYAPALRRYVEIFEEGVLVVLHDDLLQDKETTYKRILAFLGVDPTYAPAELNLTYNVGRGNTRSGTVQRMIFSNGRFKKAVKALLPQSVRHGVREAAMRLNRADTTELNRETLLMYTPLFNDDILDTARLIGRDLSDWLVHKTASPPPASVNANAKDA